MPKDKIGQEINIGDRIAYGVSLYGSSITIATGTVVDVKAIKNCKGDYHINLTVQRDPDRSSVFNKDGKYKLSTLLYPERVLVVTKQLPSVTGWSTSHLYGELQNER